MRRQHVDRPIHVLSAARVAFAVSVVQSADGAAIDLAALQRAVAASETRSFWT